MTPPEHPGRQAPSESLQEDQKAGRWDDIKFPLLAIGLPALLVYCFSSTITGLIDLFRALLQ